MKDSNIARDFSKYERHISKLILAPRKQEPPKLATDIPDDIEKFYHELGNPFRDSKTDEPITKLAPYQKRTLRNHRKYKKLLVLKSQKIGLSSLGIVIALHHALTDCQGFEIIILAQNKDKAIQHGRDMRKILAASKKYRNYLIQDRATNLGLLRDEVTKMTELFIHNRHEINNPTHIHILSPNAGAIASLKRVKFIWASDITLVEQIKERQESYFMALMSRLILTEGPVFIECPTVGILGPIFNIDQKFQERKKANIPRQEHDFYVDRINVYEAVKAGLMTPAAVESLKKEHGPTFGSYFMADWYAGENSWYTQKQMDKVNADMNYYVED